MSAGELRIVLLLASLSTGGAERVAVTLANALHRNGARPEIVIAGSEPPERGGLRGEVAAGIPVTALGHRRVRRALPALIRHLRRDPPDAILVSTTHVNLLVCLVRPFLPRASRLLVRESTHAPLTLEGRSTRVVRAAQRLLYPLADVVIASSPVMATDLRQRVMTRVEIVQNPVDVDGIRSMTAPSGGHHDTSGPTCSTTGRRFVCVGRLVPAKMLPDLLIAFAAETADDDRLILVGDGPLRPELERLAERLNVRHRVEFIGHTVRPWSFVASADVLVLASETEGMPNAVLESLALGTPVLATTDLETLRDLADTAPAGALRLVPRDHLANALAETPRDMRHGSRPTLLPASYRSDEVAARLKTLIASLHAHR